MKGSQAYRAARSEFFTKLSNGKYGGYKKGVAQGVTGPVKLSEMARQPIADAKAS